MYSFSSASASACSFASISFLPSSAIYSSSIAFFFSNWQAFHKIDHWLVEIDVSSTITGWSTHRQLTSPNSSRTVTASEWSQEEADSLKLKELLWGTPRVFLLFQSFSFLNSSYFNLLTWPTVDIYIHFPTRTTHGNQRKDQPKMVANSTCHVSLLLQLVHPHRPPTDEETSFFLRELRSTLLIKGEVRWMFTNCELQYYFIFLG